MPVRAESLRLADPLGSVPRDDEALDRKSK
jgi:hypothetical protein